MKTRIVAIFLSLFLFFAGKTASAQITLTWVGGSSGAWNNANNWNITGYGTGVSWPANLYNNDIAVINTSTTITVPSTTYNQIYQLNIGNGAVVTLVFASGVTMKITNGMTVGNYSATSLTFAGTGGESISGSCTFDQYATLTVNSGNTLTMNSGSSIGLSNSCAITNGGTINATTCTLTDGGNPANITNSGTITWAGGAFNLTSGGTNSSITNSGTFSLSASATLTLGNNNEYLSNSGTFSAKSSTIALSGAGAYLKNTSVIKATATTFSFTNGNNIQNNFGGTFTTQTGCIFNMNTSSSYIYNAGTWIEHGSTYNMEGQSAYINNISGMTMAGTTVNMVSGGGNGQNINNSGNMTIDSVSAVNCNNYQSFVTNSGTFYAGESNSSCVITLGAQAAYVYNSSTGIFDLGSTSIIYPSGYGTSITQQAGGTSPYGIFTLQSDSYGSAAIGSLGSSCSVTGTFYVQRYYQGSTTYNAITKRWIERNYRIISSPVYTGTFNGNNVYGLNYIVGATAGQTTAASSLTNAFITGCAGGSTTAGNPSTYVYCEGNTPSNTSFTSGNFIGINTITNSSTSGGVSPAGSINVSGTGFLSSTLYSLPVGTGVLFFFRGAATNFATRTKSPYIAPEAVTLTSIGSINTYTITYKDWYTSSSSNLAFSGTGTGTNYNARGFNMVGNPYPCAIDWCTAYSNTGIVRTNVNPTIYAFDPINNQYDTYTATSASGGTGNSPNSSRYIMSGQGFFVQANNTNPALSINEAAKAATQQLTNGNLLMGTPDQQTASSQLMRLRVSIDTVNYDDIAILFNSSASTAYNSNEDAVYMRGGSAPEGLSSFAADDSTRLSLNSLPLPGLNPCVIKLSLDATYTGTYTMQKLSLDAIPKLYQIWLKDKLKSDSLDMRANSTYIFDVSTADTTTFGNSRFELVIRQNPALMVHLLNFTALKATGGSQVAWTTENEENYTDFTLERSTDGGGTYTTLEGLVSTAQGTYSFLDANPVIGADSYRLKITDLNGTVSYSNIITLMYANTSNTIAGNISVYPNPASTMVNLAINQINTNTVSASGQSALQSAALNPGASLASANTSGSASYDIKILSITGSVVRSGSTTQASWQQSVSDLSPGTYVIKVLNSKDNSVVGSSTFIKL